MPLRAIIDNGVTKERNWHCESHKLGWTVKTTKGSDGHTVKGIYVACLHKPGLVPINSCNAACDRKASTTILTAGGFNNPEMNE